VGVSLVREFYAVMVENGAQGGYFVTLRGFTPAAIEYASNKAIKLVDLNILVQWHRLVETRRVSLKAVEVEDPQAPRCESGVMKVKRTGPKGVFWGCGMWPKCLCKGLV
jgi:restriction system protein